MMMERATFWIEEAAKAALAQEPAHVLADIEAEDSVLSRHGGSIHNAYADPSFALGFRARLSPVD